jgi:hypothetical protein
VLLVTDFDIHCILQDPALLKKANDKKAVLLYCQLQQFGPTHARGDTALDVDLAKQGAQILQQLGLTTPPATGTGKLSVYVVYYHSVCHCERVHGHAAKFEEILMLACSSVVIAPPISVKFTHLCKQRACR